MDAMERFILEVLQQQRDRIVAFARDIYRHPELSDQEHRTAQTVAQAFSSLGLRVQTGLSGTAWRPGWAADAAAWRSWASWTPSAVPTIRTPIP